MSDLYENLLRATDNTNNITNEKYGVITKIDNALCSIKEDEADIEHTNVPILNGEYLEVGDNVVIGFVDNSIYNPIVLGKVSKDMKDINRSTTKIIESMALNNLGTNSGANQQEINLAINSKIGQGGGGSVIGTGSFSIDNNGHLIVELPNGVDNPYFIDGQGHLIYDTSNAHNGS